MALKYMCNACGVKYESRVDAALCHPDIVLVYDNTAEQNAHLTGFPPSHRDEPFCECDVCMGFVSGTNRPQVA